MSIVNTTTEAVATYVSSNWDAEWHQALVNRAYTKILILDSPIDLPPRPPVAPQPVLLATLVMSGQERRRERRRLARKGVIRAKYW